MKKQPSHILALFACALFFVALFAPSCTSEELPAPVVSEVCDTLITTYDTNVKPIIDESCGYGGCHDGAGGIGPGNYGSYSGLLSVLQSGFFRQRTFGTSSDDISFMPPMLSTYPQQVQKDSLTTEERQILECWLDDGFPEN